MTNTIIQRKMLFSEAKLSQVHGVSTCVYAQCVCVCVCVSVHVCLCYECFISRHIHVMCVCVCTCLFSLKPLVKIEVNALLKTQ